MVTENKNFVDTKMYQIRKHAFDYGLQLRIEDPHNAKLHKELVENSFLMSSQELNDAILSDFEINKRNTWDEVLSNIEELDDVTKGVFAPNIGAAKEVVETVLKGEDLDNTEVLNKATTGRKHYSFKKANPEFFKKIYADIEKFEAKSKGNEPCVDNIFWDMTDGKRWKPEVPIVDAEAPKIDNSIIDKYIKRGKIKTVMFNQQHIGKKPNDTVRQYMRLGLKH